MADVELKEIAVVEVIVETAKERLQGILLSTATYLVVLCCGIKFIEVVSGKAFLVSMEVAFFVVLNGVTKENFD